jgi:hypothetical protein
MWNTESDGKMSTQKAVKYHDREEAIKRVRR